MPAIVRTVDTINDAHALTVLATANADHTSFNPYADEAVLVSPTMAVWLLEAFDFPYRHCQPSSVSANCNIPLIAWLGRGLDVGDQAAAARGYALLSHFIRRGEQLNDLADDGLAPIHEAILYRNARYLRVLLEAGADPSVRIDQPQRPADGLDAGQFLELLDSQKVADFSQVRAVLDQY
ncbi:MAG: hypothetical protein DHS20C11_23630 [Lysobacteraceae bacterium]|nr:MAG: hypothetical protein DHS20C11_23630 [Xanthomonadaceae bacterium]